VSTADSKVKYTGFELPLKERTYEYCLAFQRQTEYESEFDYPLTPPFDLSLMVNPNKGDENPKKRL